MKTKPLPIEFLESSISYHVRKMVRYTLRNKQMKNFLKRVWKRRFQMRARKCKLPDEGSVGSWATSSPSAGSNYKSGCMVG